MDQKGSKGIKIDQNGSKWIKWDQKGSKSFRARPGASCIMADGVIPGTVDSLSSSIILNLKNNSCWSIYFRTIDEGFRPGTCTFSVAFSSAIFFSVSEWNIAFIILFIWTN